MNLGIEPPKGVLLYGPPGTGKTLCARAVANRTDACFIRVIGSELVQKYVGEGARMVRELFEMARTKKACLIFFDEIDAVGGARFDDGMGGDNEVQRTMLELINQLDGFDPRGNIKVSDKNLLGVIFWAYLILSFRFSWPPTDPTPSTLPSSVLAVWIVKSNSPCPTWKVVPTSSKSTPNK